MNGDAELEAWRRQWQSEIPVPADPGAAELRAAELRRKVERQSRFMKIMLAADILVTVGMGGGTIALAARSTGPDWWLLAAFTWIFIAAAWAFSLRVNRGNWRPHAVDTATYLDLAVRRCRGRLAALRFGGALYACQIVFCLGWVYHHQPRPRPALGAWLWFATVPIDAVWAVTVAFFIFLFWYRRRKLAELAWFENLTAQNPENSGAALRFTE